MKRLSLVLCCVLVGSPVWAQQQGLADGLYAVILGKPGVGRVLYRLDTVSSSPQVVRFLSEYGGVMSEDPQDSGRFVVTDPKPVTVRWLIRGVAAGAGAVEWEIPAEARVSPPSPNPADMSQKAVLAFWRQRNQLRSDILLLTGTDGGYRPLQHRAFAYAVGPSVVPKLKVDGEVWLGEVLAQGDAARRYMLDYQQGTLGPENNEALWLAWLTENYPRVANEVSSGSWKRDAYGFYLPRNVRERETSGDAANVEFSYSYQSLQFADLQGELSGVALLGRDRLQPVVDYFLQRVPAGETWSILVPPWLRQMPGERKDGSWYRYTISVTAIF